MKNVKNKYKYLIAALSFLVGSGILLGIIKINSQNSSQNLGFTSPDEKKLGNVFLDKNSQPQIYLLSLSKEQQVASFENNDLNFVTYKQKKYNYKDFFDAFFRDNGYLPILEINYGSFKFFNEYLEAVNPEEFLKFTKWFVKNVSWGPDILTLNSFSIVKGIERNGNTITLGQHVNLKKENQNIKFYPDAFFGSFSLFSELKGEGNMQDSLLYKFNKNSVSEKEVLFLLDNVKKMNIAANFAKDAKNFRNVHDIKNLLNQKVFVYWDPKLNIKQILPLSVEKTDITEKEVVNLLEKKGILKGKNFVYDKNNLKKYQIINALYETPKTILNRYSNLDFSLEKNENSNFENEPVFYLRLIEDEKTKKIKEASKDEKLLDFIFELDAQIAKGKKIPEKEMEIYQEGKVFLESFLYSPDLALMISENDFSASTLLNLDLLSDYEKNRQTIDFLDYYDLGKLVGKKVLLYQSDDKKTKKSDLDISVDLISNMGDDEKSLPEIVKIDLKQKQNITLFTNDEINFRKNYSQLVNPENFLDSETKKKKVPPLKNENLNQAILKQIKVENGILKIELLTEKVIYSYEINSQNISEFEYEFIQQLFYHLGYVKYIDPYLINLDSDIIDEKNKQVRTFSIYGAAYQNLLDNISRKMPYLLTTRKGPHVVKKMNKEGVIEYKLEEGFYRGFSLNDNLGLWAVLSLSDPNFGGMSSDFLRFVGAHEYGHHVTLASAQDLSNQQSKPLLISAQKPNISTLINDFWSKENVDLYLKARTHLKVKNSNVYLQSSDVVNENVPLVKGNFANFGFLKQDGTYQYETESDVWGAKKSEIDIKKALTNKSRRFLQTFEGLKEALEARKEKYQLADEVSLFDLFVANAFDEQSGTLNPNFKGKAKYFVANEESPTKFSYQEGQVSQLKNQLKDGKGNLIPFDDKSNKFVLFGFAFFDEKDNEITSPTNKSKIVLVKNDIYRDNDFLFVNILPGSVLSFDQYQKLKKIEQDFNDNINNFIVKEFAINGWNSRSSVLTTDLQIFNSSPIALENISNSSFLNDRNEVKKAVEFYKNFVNKRAWDQIPAKAFAFQSKNVRNGDKFVSYYFPIFYDPQTFYGPEYFNHLFVFEPGLLEKAKLKNQLPLPFPPFSQKEAVKFFETVKKISSLSAEDLEKLKKETFNLRNKQQIYDLFMSIGFAWRGLFVEFQVLDSLGSNKLFLNAQHQYVPNPEQTRITLKNNRKIITFPYKKASFLNNSPISISAVANGLVGFKNMNNQVFKDYSFWMLPPDSKSYYENAYFYADENGNFIEIEDFSKPNGKEKTATSLVVNLDFGINDETRGIFGKIKLSRDKNFRILNNLEEILAFMSVDYKKAKVEKVKDKLVVNWDVDYVSERIDLASFLTEYIKYLKNYSGKVYDKQTLSKLIAKFDKSLEENKQEVANLAMSRFLKSGYVPFAKDYQIKDLANAMWILDKNLGIANLKTKFTDLKNEDSTSNENVEKYILTIKKYAEDNDMDFAKMTLFDLMLFTGTAWFLPDFSDSPLNLKEAGQFEVTNGVSSDVDVLFNTKIYTQASSIFSDYVFTYAEQINRDYLQTTYTPFGYDFGNKPNYISNINEINTGLEYLVDGEASQKYKNYGFDPKITIDVLKKYLIPYFEEQDNRQKKLNLEQENWEFIKDEGFNYLSKYENNFFGKIRTFNNGFYKDRFYREILGWELYDENGLDKKDDSIQILDLLGEKVNYRAKAYWQYFIQSQGIGSRNISGFWRDQNKDAVGFFGFFGLEDSEKIKYLAFEEVESGKKSYLPIHIKNTNNMFYYKKQSPENAYSDNNRHYLKDEPYFDKKNNVIKTGFTSWVSDYALVSQYKNRLVSPGKNYWVYFVDESKNKIEDVNLGSLKTMAENGKLFGQAPLRMEKFTDKNGKIKTKLIVKDQFNAN